jgi:hypothetical protein
MSLGGEHVVGTGSGLCAMAGSGIGKTGPLNSLAIELVSVSKKCPCEVRCQDGRWTELWVWY